ncbi:MAG TPA: hypothetical protein VF476_07120 [Chitinophagaceae bacterium]
MDTHLQTIIIRFDDTASQIYSDVFHQFQEFMNNTDRSVNENIYKMQEAKAIFSLKNRLEQLTAELLEKNKDYPLYTQLHASFSARVDYYLQEFRRKTTSG